MVKDINMIQAFVQDGEMYVVARDCMVAIRAAIDNEKQATVNFLQMMHDAHKEQHNHFAVALRRYKQLKGYDGNPTDS